MSEKRSAEDNCLPIRRYTRIKLASPSPERSGGSDTESIHSCQGYETELVKDTSDTSSSPTYNIEYEIADTEEPKNKICLTDDSDDSDETAGLNDVYRRSNESSFDIALLGDTSEENSTSPTSNSDVDPGLPRSDYLDFETCVLCKTKEKDISYPYCPSCFSWKKDFYPDRPNHLQKIKKKGSSQSTDNNASSSQENKTTSTEVENSVENEPAGRESEGCSQDSGVGSSEPLLSEDVVDTVSPGPSTSTPSTSNQRKLTLGLCRVCFVKPENGLFVHSSKAHLYGCYTCAKKIWYYSKVCPICRRKIFKVSKLFV